MLAAHPNGDLRIEFVPGGDSRQDSVLAALTACEGHTGLVHIHDGARPLVTAEAIRKVREKAHEMGGAILAGRAADTVKIAKEHSASVGSSPDRALVWTAETPQVFRTSIVLKAYRKVSELGRKVTDDSSAVEFVGQDVALVENPSVNLKLTRPADFVLAEAILKTREALSSRTGVGRGRAWSGSRRYPAGWDDSQVRAGRRPGGLPYRYTNRPTGHRRKSPCH